MSEDTGSPRRSAASARPFPVPPLLADLAGWTWRLLLLALAGYLLVQLFDTLYFVLLPTIAALFATSLAMPLVRFLRQHGFSRGLATALTALVAIVVFGGLAVFVVDRAVAEYPQLVSSATKSVASVRRFLTNDLHIRSSSTAGVGNTVTSYLDAHSSSLANGALSGIATVGEGAAAFVLWVFITFFFMYDGDRIWDWLVKLFPPQAQHRVRGAGDEAWARLAGFVRGTFIIAVIHGVVTAVTLSLLGVPLVAPLALLVFFGSFLPIVGSIIFGTLAVLVTLVTQGVVPGIILTIVLVIDNQIEAHLLQPFLVGRYVRLHPLAIAISIAGGGLLEGIYGAILAVPFVAVVYAVLHYLITGRDTVHPDASEDGGIAEEDGPGGGSGPDGGADLVPEVS